MNVVVICSLCLLIFVPIVVNGLECYECTICNDPFNKNNANITIVNGTNEYCYKIAASNYLTSRGATTSCVAAHVLSVGTWCCNTDLCNTAPSTVSMNFKLLIPTLLLATALIKIIQSK